MRVGFTLIELLVVIGIILLLIGLFYGGVKLVTAQAKQRQTRTMLETCMTMFDNYKQATNLSRVPMVIPVSRAKIYTCNLSALPAGTEYGTESLFWTAGQIDAPGPGNIPNSSQGSTYTIPNPPSIVDPAFLDTICVMYTLESIPENKTIVNNLPPTDILKVTFIATTGPAANTQMSVVLVLDAWGNPILFVPGGGLGMNTPQASPGSAPSWPVSGVVCLDGTNYGVVTSGGVVTGTTSFITNPANGEPVTPATYDAANLPTGIMIATHPFFVSAGPDGDFSNAHGNTVPTAPTLLPNSSMTDDNIYSFK